MSTKGQTPPALDEAAGSAQYHLIEEGWVMRADDEALEPDCTSWWRLDSHPIGRWMIGAEYTPTLFVPIRRAGKRPDDTSELLPPNKPSGEPPTGRL